MFDHSFTCLTMNAPTMKATAGSTGATPRPIQNILAVFEANVPDKERPSTGKGKSKKRKERRQTSKNLREKIEAFDKRNSNRTISSTSTKEKNSKKKRKERRQKSKILEEKIVAYQKETDSSSLRISRRSNTDLDRWEFEDVRTRKVHLLRDTLNQSVPRISSRDLAEIKFDDLPSRKTTLMQSFASAEKRSEALSNISRKPKKHKRRFNRRASTQRIRVWDNNQQWEFSGRYATQCALSQSKRNEDTTEKPEDCRAGLERRHSTGCLGYLDTHSDPSGDFWQVYEQDNRIEPTKPITERFTRKRGVRFAQHVTVWVFSKDIDAQANSDLPQAFLHRTSEGDQTEITLQQMKTKSEDRFSAGKVGSAPSMPSRRNLSATIGKAYNREPKLSNIVASPPKQPQRQLTKRELVGPKQPQPCLSSEDEIGSLKKAIESNLTSSPRKPQRRPTDHEPSSPQGYLLSVDLCGSPKKPERKATNHDPTARSPRKPERQITNHEAPKPGTGLLIEFHDSRGSKTSKATYLYDSFADENANASSGSTDSDIQSIDSSMFSAESSFDNQYDNDVSRSETAIQESEECRRERALMWYRRWACPSYEMMKHHVCVTPGLGITAEDVDLLPWSTTNALYKVVM